jgi:hypothetical protein
MKVLVCGGRGFRDRMFLFEVMSKLHKRHEFTCLVHGDAGSLVTPKPPAPPYLIGADRLAGEWAKENGIEVRSYPISQNVWNELGRYAGPERNKRMLDIEDPHLVVAFPGGPGTASMVGLARADGCPVITVPATLRAFWASL